MAMYSDLGVKPLFSNRSNSVLKRVSSEQQFNQVSAPNQQESNGGNAQRSSRIRVLLPKIASKRELRISVSPLPTLPFPRVFGKDIVSPFRGGASSTMQIRSSQLTQESSSPIKSVKFDYTDTPSEQVQKLRHSMIAPSEKTLAILQMHQKRTLNPFNQTVQVQQPPPQLAIEQPDDHLSSANSTVSVTKTTRIKIRETRVNSTPPVEERSILQSEKKERKKKKIDVREFMKAKGLNPTPIEFFKLLKNESDMQEFFCYCNRRQDYYDFEVVPFNDKNENEYMTVSKRGLVLFIKGLPQFISIEEWEREASIYRKIRRIKFFNHFKSWKTFSNWKMNQVLLYMQFLEDPNEKDNVQQDECISQERAILAQLGAIQAIT